jgi:hypothetical protein
LRSNAAKERRLSVTAEPEEGHRAQCLRGFDIGGPEGEERLRERIKKEGMPKEKTTLC